MFAAQIAHKLPHPLENTENLLTSNVFGLWRYLPPEAGLLQFLQTAERLDGKRFSVTEKVQTIDLQFWPWLQEQNAKGAEPDVLIEMLSFDQQRYLVLIEAKYLSPKSSLPDDSTQPNDQLAREMHNLRKLAHRKGIHAYTLIYVTAHTTMPRMDMEEAISELARKTGEGASDRFYWTSWRRLPEILTQAAASCEGVTARMLVDLRTIVCQLGLLFFEGISYRGRILSASAWKFKPTRAEFMWKCITVPHYVFHETPLKFAWLLTFRPKILWRWRS